MMERPENAKCRCLLADGRVLTITASRRPRAGRADVKCQLPAAPALAVRLLEVVRLARLCEPVFDSRDQVVLSMDIVPLAGQREWELAAVLADRMVRGCYRAPAAEVYAQGWSDAWQLGRLNTGQALAIGALRRHTGPAACLIVAAAEGAEGVEGGDMRAGLLTLSHLGALTGHADPSAAVSTARAWFPLFCGGAHDVLSWVEVSVRPLAAQSQAEEEEDTISAPGLDAAAQLAVRQTLVGARHFDGRALGRWRTAVRFEQPLFQGSSYQLALVLADRLARGREFVPRGRLIASGCSSAWHAGTVDSVDGLAPKCALILAQAGPGDRVLLPAAWQPGLPDGFVAELNMRGASLACIDRIGMI